MNAHTPRKFEIKPAVRDRVPLLIGLVGPSSSGKTKSALRLAEGITSVFGGETYLIDTESRRALHYADQHKFRHVEFKAPYGSLDYLDAIRQCVNAGASCVIIDSMSHEHESEGGLLDMQEQELTRMAGDDWRKREQVKFAAWIKPKRHRTMLIQGLLALNCNFIFCFRAREKTRPIKGSDGKTTFVQVGFQPIAGDEFLYEQTVNCLLLPKSGGVPTWKSTEIGERELIKLPNYLSHCFKEGPLDEETGKCLALWAKGGNESEQVRTEGVTDQSRKAEPTAQVGEPIAAIAPDQAAPQDPEADLLAQIRDDMWATADEGIKALEKVWMDTHPRWQHVLVGELPAMKERARLADAHRKALDEVRGG